MNEEESQQEVCCVFQAHGNDSSFAFGLPGMGGVWFGCSSSLLLWRVRLQVH